MGHLGSDELNRKVPCFVMTLPKEDFGQAARTGSSGRQFPFQRLQRPMDQPMQCGCHATATCVLHMPSAVPMAADDHLEAAWNSDDIPAPQVELHDDAWQHGA
ncbi:hypothetical protein SPRG_00822 [Saprolegnia parasitica CBS 223.65]|uniref:Uncharacterized protein n=1 Tax=Saprolegnia parasitica (strain CBS 223.65) TaxID=695850 RepID=A0A067D7Z4_SAPPC|nr:hypothetical protein SPRG_00822 [Saprolegnia parasitica CBS 223.65]KDO34761.1 hypothetical protein SPRG_00822 [Saprolegnia parasitica CBS 223.65]|eukprot:XP_012194428.1 hypothetical protein SPRG_00822 [Saprolegnia parasitica CBS 223.65]